MSSSFILWLQKSVAYGLLLFVVLGSFLAPSEVSAFELPGTDKWHHTIAYMLLTLAFLWPLKQAVFKTYWKVIIPIAILGAVIEPLQPIISPGRSCDSYDFLADCIGIFLATLIILSYKYFNSNK